MSPTDYGATLLGAIARHCEADAGREVCGFVLRRGDGLVIEPITNVADRFHAVDPAHFPRTSRNSYLMDPKEQLRVHRELDTQGEHIVAIWHSHVETGAYFSAKDRADAIVDGAPAVPDVDYLVFGVRCGRVAEVKCFRWDGQDFLERPMPTLPSLQRRVLVDGRG